MAATLGTVAALRPGQRIAAPLHDKPPVMRGLGRLHGIGLGLRPAVELFEDQFVLLGLDPLFLDAAAHRHEEEQGPHGDAQRREEFGHLVQQVDIPPADRGVDLHGHAQFASGQEHLARPLEAAFPAAEVVVDLGVGPSRLMPSRLMPAARTRAKASCVASGVAEGVRAISRPTLRPWAISSIRSCRFSGSPPVSTTIGRLGNWAAWKAALLCSVLSCRGRNFLRRCPAVLADQVAGRGGLVIEHQRTVIEVGCRVGRVIHANCPRDK